MSDETEPARLLAEVHGACVRLGAQLLPVATPGGRGRVADCVLEGARRLGALGRARQLQDWLFAVVRKTALGRQRVWLTWLRRRSDEDPASQPADAAAAPDEDGARVRAALAGLARRQREVLDLVFYHDLTVEQAARVMGVSLGSARRHYARAKDNLAEKLR